MTDGAGHVTGNRLESRRAFETMKARTKGHGQNQAIAIVERSPDCCQSGTAEAERPVALRNSWAAPRSGEGFVAS